MEHGRTDGRQYKALVGGKIEFDTRPSTGTRRYGAAIGQLTLARNTAARVGVNIEHLLIGGHLNARMFIDPFNDVGEHPLEERIVEMCSIGEREIQIL